MNRDKNYCIRLQLFFAFLAICAATSLYGTNKYSLSWFDKVSLKNNTISQIAIIERIDDSQNSTLIFYLEFLVEGKTVNYKVTANMAEIKKIKDFGDLFLVFNNKENQEEIKIELKNSDLVAKETLKSNCFYKIILQDSNGQVINQEDTVFFSSFRSAWFLNIIKFFYEKLDKIEHTLLANDLKKLNIDSPSSIYTKNSNLIQELLIVVIIILLGLLSYLVIKLKKNGVDRDWQRLFLQHKQYCEKEISNIGRNIERIKSIINFQHKIDDHKNAYSSFPVVDFEHRKKFDPGQVKVKKSDPDTFKHKVIKTLKVEDSLNEWWDNNKYKVIESMKGIKKTEDIQDTLKDRFQDSIKYRVFPESRLIIINPSFEQSEVHVLCIPRLFDTLSIQAEQYFNALIKDFKRDVQKIIKPAILKLDKKKGMEYAEIIEKGEIECE